MQHQILGLLILALQSRAWASAEAHHTTALRDDTPICKINQTLCGATCLSLYDDLACCDNQYPCTTYAYCIQPDLCCTNTLTLNDCARHYGFNFPGLEDEEEEEEEGFWPVLPSSASISTVEYPTATETSSTEATTSPSCPNTSATSSLGDGNLVVTWSTKGPGEFSISKYTELTSTSAPESATPTTGPEDAAATSSTSGTADDNITVVSLNGAAGMKHIRAALGMFGMGVAQLL